MLSVKNLVVRMDPEIHRQFKSICAAQGKTLQEKVNELIKRELANAKRRKGA